MGRKLVNQQITSQIEVTDSGQPRNARRQTASDDTQPELAVAGTLARSVVYRRLPVHVRSRLDSAILLRPKHLPTLEAIAAHFELSKHGISPAALRSYARRLEELARPAAAGQVLAAVFGCLPGSYRRQLMAGTQVVLLGRVIQALSAQKSEPLTVAEMARLGTLLSAMARSSRPREGVSAKQSHRKLLPAAAAELQPSRIAELVRGIYGVSLPAPAAVPSSIEASGGMPKA